MMLRSLICSIIICLGLMNSGICQSLNDLFFHDQTIESIIKELEANSHYIFNFKDENLENQTYTGSFNFQNLDSSLTNLLYNTPLEFEITNNQILIIKPDRSPWRICGTIKSKAEDSTLAFANIYFQDIQRGTQADSLGFFEMKVEGYKNDQIEFSYVGYEPITMMLQDFDQCRGLSMKIDHKYLKDEIVIRDYILKGITEGVYAGALHFDMPLVRQQAIGVENDILKTAQLLSGISSLDDSASRINIRGSSFDHNLIGWENATLYDPGHFFGMISSINPFVVKTMDIYKTVFDPKFENRIGGVVDISLDKEQILTTEIGAGITFTEAHFYLKAPIIKEQMSLILSARHSINNVIKSPTIKSYSQKLFQANRQEENEESTDENYREAEEDLNFYDVNAKLLYRPNQFLNFSLAYFRSYNEYNYFSLFSNNNFESIDKQNSNTSAFNGKLDLHWSSRWKTNLYYSRSFYDNFTESAVNLLNNVNASSINTRNNIVDQQLGLLTDYHINKSVRLSFGYIYEDKSVDIELDEQYQFQQGLSDKELASGNFHNLIASYHMNSNRWSIMAGIRSSYYMENSKLFTSPRFQLQYKINDHLKAKMSGGKLYQFISQLSNFTDNQIHDFSNLWILSDQDVKTFLHSYKFSGGLAFKKNGWLIDVETYIHQTKGLNNFSSSINEFIGSADSGESKIIGLDLIVNKSWGPYKIWANYSLSSNKIVIPNISDEYFPSDINQTNQFNLIQQYELGKFQFSLHYNFKSGLPFSEPEDELEETDSDELLTNLFGINFEEFNGERLPDYHRVDLGLQYKSSFLNNKLQYECGLSLVNIMNRKNILSRDFLLADLEQDQLPEIIEIDKILLKRTPQIFFRLYW